MKITFLLIGIAALIMSACKKSYRCEMWEVNDQCTETGNCYYVGCNSYPTGIRQVEICGDALREAQLNNMVTTDGECTTRKRTFIRKL